MENNEKDDTPKKKLETLSGVMSLIYKAAAAVGALVTFAYLFLIHFFPSGLTPGEVIFFVFIALAFAFIYAVFIGYGAFSALWLAHLITFLFRSPRYRDKKLVAQLFDPIPSSMPLSWRRFRLTITRAALDKKSLVPKFAQGWTLGIASVLAFTLFAIQAYLGNSVRFAEFAWTGLFVGIMVLMLLTADTPSEFSANAKTRIAAIALIPLLIIFTYLGPMPFFSVVFRGLGIRAENVAIEMPDSELGNIERISDLIRRPLIDCRRAQPGKILVHDADVLWTGIGDQTLIRLRGYETEKRSVFAAERNNIPEAVFNLETKSLHIIKTKPYIDPCFDLPDNQLFNTGKDELGPEAKLRLKDLADAIVQHRKPVKLAVHGHSVAGDTESQAFAKRRVTAVAATLKEQIDNPELVVFSDGTGSREGRIEVRVSYGR